MIKLIVGLGNPGPEYEATRHNAGFWWLDALARDWGVTPMPDKAYAGHVARSTQAGQPRWLLKPMTFMNRSGQSVGALARFFKIAPEEVLVVHDELDFAPGTVKLKLGGSHGGHNGLRDIHAQLGPNYWRLRIGIGHPGVKDQVPHWVLQKPSPTDREAILGCFDRCLLAVPEMLTGDFTAAQQRIHTDKPQRPKPPRPSPAAGTNDATPPAAN